MLKKVVVLVVLIIIIPLDTAAALTTTTEPKFVHSLNRDEGGGLCWVRYQWTPELQSPRGCYNIALCYTEE